MTAVSKSIENVFNKLHNSIVQLAKSTTDGAGACGSPKTIDDQKGPHQPNILGAPEHKRGSILNPNTNNPVKDRPLKIEEARKAFDKLIDDPHYGMVKGSQHWVKVYYDGTYKNRSTTGAYFGVSPFEGDAVHSIFWEISLFEDNPDSDVISDEKLLELLENFQGSLIRWNASTANKELIDPDPTITIYTGLSAATDPATKARIESYTKQLNDYLSAHFKGSGCKLIFSPETKPQMKPGVELSVGDGIIGGKLSVKILVYGF